MTRIWRRLRHRHRELDEQVEQARAERELSQRRLESMRAGTVAPLDRAGERNQFAEIIRRSIAAGHQGGRA